MHLLSYIKEIRKNGQRCFTISDIVKHYNISLTHARVALHRLLKAGDLISPVRGLYVIIPPEHLSQGSIPAQDLVPLIMQFVGAKYYVALLTAGMYHGATHQKAARFQVITNKRMKHPLTFGAIEIDFIYKKSLMELPTQDVAVSTGYLKVATPELVALDLLIYPNHAGGLNHIATVLSELVEKLDAIKLIGLAKKIDAENQLQRIGYILDRIEAMDEEQVEKIIEILATEIALIKPKYLPLASEIPIKGYTRCKKWKIIENIEIEGDL